jgi:hypothetical protein
MGARRETLKPLLPVRKRFFKTPSKLKDELAYLETLTDGDDVASDFLFVRRAKASVRSCLYGRYLHDGCRFQHRPLDIQRMNSLWRIASKTGISIDGLNLEDRFDPVIRECTGYCRLEGYIQSSVAISDHVFRSDY